jgi:hypothetical protein
MARRDANVREIYRLAKLSSVVTTEKRVAESGLKSAFDFEETNQFLADLSANGEFAEFEISRLWWKLAAPEGKAATITIRWPKKFDILSLDDELKQAMLTTSLKMPGAWWKLAKRSIALHTLQRTDASNKEILEVVKAINEQPDTLMDTPIETARQTADKLTSGTGDVKSKPAPAAA